MSAWNIENLTLPVKTIGPSRIARGRGHIMVSALALCMALPQMAAASSFGGLVTDSIRQATFAGAVVHVEEINRSVVTDRFGRYRLNGLEPGADTITIKYIGVPTVMQAVSIPQPDAVIDFVIGDDVAYEDNIIVVGTKAAQASALNQQRASNVIKTIIDSDGLGNFPDTTVAGSLSRVVGISVETDQVEGRYVSIRGINTDLMSCSINGVRPPSPEDRRGVLVGGVPFDLLDGIEAQKSLTPDVDADSLGGIIDLKTVSAFDRRDSFLRVSGNYRGDFWDELQGAELDRYADGRFRVEASAKYRVTKQLQVYLEGRNLTNAPEYFYFGDENRLSQYDEFGRTVVFGTRFT